MRMRYDAEFDLAPDETLQSAQSKIEHAIADTGVYIRPGSSQVMEIKI